MEIRPATTDDTEALLSFAERLFAEKLPGIYERPVPTLEEEREFVRAHTEPDNSILLMAEENGEVVGLLGLIGGSLLQEAHCGEFGISVARGFRGQGVGTRLIEEMLAWAPKHGVSRIEVKAFAPNESAIALYRRMGFQDEGVQRGAVMVGGKPTDVLLLARLL